MSARTMEPLSYDPRGAFLETTGIAPADLEALRPRLLKARDEVLSDAELWAKGAAVPEAKHPLDAGFTFLPDRLLAEYRDQGATSEVGRIIAAANRIAEAVDRIVVLGIGGSYMGARALLESCCHAYHNELPRAARDARPRISFEGNNVDNDASQGLLDLLGRGAEAKSVDDRWGILVISKSGGTLETAAAFRQFLAALRQSTGRDANRLAQLVVPVTGPSGRLFDLAKALGCPDVFNIPDGVGGRFSIFTAVGLLPAAVLGLDIVKLLEGAALANAHFQTQPPGHNVALDYVGVCHLMEEKRGATIRLLSTWGKGLEAAGLWYDQLLSESLGKQEKGATPITVVNTRDLHSRGQQHQEGKRDKLVTNVIVDRYNRDRLAIGRSDLDQDKLNELADKTLPDVMAAAIAGTNEAYREDGRPTTDLHLPRLDEATMGQFFQMLMLATATEGRLIGINPYGQPGVEGYKKHMNAFLRGKK
ncbi:MAG: glucose-6-phosphate isomerase [Planctomycetia bacterium]|nr:glucose-6-phosphate isomerase [Planctomycetia bacterium]